MFALGFLQKGSFSFSSVFASVAFIGIIIIFTTQKESLNSLALFFVGFGMLFIGLEVMEFAIGGRDSLLSQELSKVFRFDAMKNPALLVLLGVIFTCIINSSTAATGVFITFLATGIIDTPDQGFFLVMGANIGTCSDGILAAIGTNTSGRRVAAFHVLTSTIGAVAFSIILVLFKEPIMGLFNRMFTLPAWSLATFNLAYNTIYTLVLLPFLDPLIGLVSKVIKDKGAKGKQQFNIDDRILATPAIAIDQALIEVANMLILSKENLDRAFGGLLDGDMGQSKKIAECEYRIDDITRALASFFIKLTSAAISGRDKQLIGRLHHVINDIERIGDHAVIFAKETN